MRSYKSDVFAIYLRISTKIFFDGQIYDAFSLLIDLVASATKSLVLVDNYVDVGTLEIHLCSSLQVWDTVD